MRNGLFVDSDGSQYWYLNGKRHRADGPAVIYADGTQKWYLNGKIHRENGPAFFSPSNHKEWYLNDKCHREDGPAIIDADGSQWWFLNGVEYSFKEYVDCIFTEDSPEKTLFILKWSGS